MDGWLLGPNSASFDLSVLLVSYVSNARSCSTADVSFVYFSFFSPRDLRAPLTDRRETLPRDWKLVQFYNLGLTYWGHPRKKNWWPKTCKIRVDFGQL